MIFPIAFPEFFRGLFKKKHPQISLIVPYRRNKSQPRRIKNWRWLKRYLKVYMPDAELIVANSNGRVFSKSNAVNRAVRKSKGRVLVVIDADCYIDTEVIQYCADKIDQAEARGQRRWFIPYRALFRLTLPATDRVLFSPPYDPYRFPSPPNDADVESTVGSMHGKRYGAMIQIFSRKAFEMVGGWDERFRGWGGEDISNARKLDTIYGKHKTTPNDVLHLWHPKIGDSFKTRKWEGQTIDEPNGNLAARYSHATGDRELMRKLMFESIDYAKATTLKNRFISRAHLLWKKLFK